MIIMAKYYGGQGYLSVWLGDCESQELFNEYIEYGRTYDEGDEDDDEKSAFKLGEDFGIMFYDEDFSLVSFLDEKTDDLGLLLDTGAPEYVIEEYKKMIGSQLERKYNCCVMFYEMKYTGKMLETIESKYGVFTFIGSIEADVDDI